MTLLGNICSAIRLWGSVLFIEGSTLTLLPGHSPSHLLYQHYLLSTPTCQERWVASCSQSNVYIIKFNPKIQFQMKVKLIRSYRSKNGNATFVYGVTGSDADLAAYKTAQGEFYREDDTGTPLWFTTRCIGQTGKLIITTNGNIVPDMSAFDQAASISAQYGGNFGQELARQAAQSVLGMDAAPSAPAQEAHLTEEPKEELGDL